MTYQETVKYLYDCVPMFQNIGAHGYKEGLANTLALDKHLGHPHRCFRTIHVAGTNGKGSCSHTLAAILQSAGYKVGLYTSPHFVDFRERIKVNGTMVSEDFVVDFVEKERSFFEPLCPSFFEVTTAMAFKYFAEQKVDIAVIEVGLGGRLDCTNIITPILSIITNISYDHTQFLGNTLAEIATEKAGIIKHGVPVVVGEDLIETRPVFANKALEMEAPIVFAQDKPEVLSHDICYTDSSINYHTLNFGEVWGELGGLCQEKNTNTILTALPLLKEAGLRFENKDVRKGFAHVCEMTGLMGRWQVIARQPYIVCDTAHNEGGFRYIARQLRAQQCRQMHIVFGMVNDKDVSAVLAMLPKDAKYYFAKAKVKRALDEQVLQQKAETFGLKGKAFTCVARAYEAAVSQAANDDFVYIGGSSYVVADLLAFIKTSR